ncbi:MAG TPA: O-antigen ligase family protein [Solirubrobacteraceae bacterium]|nr:O-antigen ligase family protein [Solirubrobacteraceae bacterium]
MVLSSATRTSKLTTPLRAAPATVPALAALVVLVVWASSQGGYPLTHWAPGALVLLALLGITLLVVPLRAHAIPLAVKVAVACLAAYTALSFGSIAWAAVPANAWEGANRTLLYLLVFALFALWPQNGRSATLLLCMWTLAMIGLAGFVALRVDAAAASPARLQALLPGGRLAYPAGYTNANAAQWLMAFWPALLLAREARLHWLLRGLLAGGAVMLAEVALLSVSRGALYSTPVVLVLVFALLPGRTRTFAVLIPVAAAFAAAVPAVLHLGDRISHAQNATAAVHTATVAIFAAALAAGLAVALGAAIESRRTLEPAPARRLHRAVGAIALTALVAILLGGWVAAGDPVARARHAWDTFKSEQGYAANSSGNRLISGLGSSRYDFYRVALDEFAAHPLLGIGVDNFQQQYLVHGRSEETPRYPHSVELRTLAETGLVGALLALLGLGGALLAGARALRRADDPLARAAAAAALAGFAYWVVHGSFDWFWEFAGLGAPAFALLGLGCALAPRKVASAPSSVVESSAGAAPDGGGVWVGAHGSSDATSPLPRRAWIVAAIIGAICAAASLIAPWLSDLQVQSAARIWARAPAVAYARLADAARLNPLSDEPYLVAGNIAVRLGGLTRAQHEFSLALERVPAEPYATLELGALASSKGERARALALLARAHSENPRDPLTREALELARRGQRVEVERLDRSILQKAQRFV